MAKYNSLLVRKILAADINLTRCSTFHIHFEGKNHFIKKVYNENVIVGDLELTQENHLDQAATCDIYIGLLGYEYGHENSQGISSTEEEYQAATKHQKIRLIFIKHRETFQRNYLDYLLKEQLIERTIPDKPQSRSQKYRLSQKGQTLLDSLSLK